MSSSSSTSRNITFTEKSGNFMSFISCDLGDVYVDYDKEGDYNDSNYHPLYSADNPRTLELNISNSMNIPFVVDSVVWKVNGDDVVTTAGLSQIYVAQANGLELLIKGSIAAASLNQSITITAEATVIFNQDNRAIVRSTYYIPVRQSNGNLWHVTIAATDEKSNYTINNGENIVVRCLVYDPKGTLQNAGDFKYVWSKLENGAWDVKGTNQGAVANVEKFTINRAMVDNQAMFKVEVFPKNEGGTGYSTEPLGMDTQMIYDALDYYSIIVSPSAEENIEQGSNAQIDYLINIYNANQQANARKAKLSFYLHAYGIIPVRSETNMNWDVSYAGTTKGTHNGTPDTYGPNSPMFYVREQDFLNHGTSALTLDINAEILEG